jgi:hypothetical protein
VTDVRYNAYTSHPTCQKALLATSECIQSLTTSHPHGASDNFPRDFMLPPSHLQSSLQQWRGETMSPLFRTLTVTFKSNPKCSPLKGSAGPPLDLPPAPWPGLRCCFPCMFTHSPPRPILLCGLLLAPATVDPLFTAHLDNGTAAGSSPFLPSPWDLEGCLVLF